MSTIEQVLFVVRSVARQHRLVDRREADPPAIGADTDLLIGADLDSVAIIEVVTSLEAIFQVRLLDRVVDVAQLNTPAGLASLIEGRTAPSESHADA